MKHCKLAAAVGIALGVGAAQAWALVPGDVVENNRLYISGATATDQVLGRLFVVDGAGICDISTPLDATVGGKGVDVYTSAGTNAADITQAQKLARIFGGNKAILCKSSAQAINLGTG